MTSATTPTVLACLVRDRVIQLAAAITAIEVLSLLAPIWPDGALGALSPRVYQIPLVGLGAVAVFDGLQDVVEQNERAFWASGGVAAVLWMALLVTDTALRGRTPSLGIAMAMDAIELAVVLFLFVGLEYRPHVPVGRLPRQARLSRRLRFAGLVVLFGGWYVYFVVVPVIVAPAYYVSGLPARIMLATALLAISCRYLMALAVSPPGRGWIWGALTLGTAGLFVNVLLNADAARRGLPVTGTNWLDLAPVPAILTLIVAVRLRRVPRSPRPLSPEDLRYEARDFEAERSSALLLAKASTFPIANVAQQVLVQVPNDLKQAQDAAGLLGMLALAALAAVSYYVLDRDRRAAERAHAEFDTHLREAQTLAAISRLAAVSAREVGAAMTTVRVGLERLQDTLPPVHAARDLLAELRGSLDGLGAFTQHLRTISRQMPLRVRPLSVNAFLQTLAPVLREVTKGAVRIDLALGEEAGVVTADEDALRSVLLTLARNARDAMPHGGTLVVATSRIDLPGREAVARAVRPGRYGVIRVTDQGRGMSRDLAAHVFEPYYESLHRDPALGLSLAGVHAMIAQQGGTIRVRSEVGAGTTFEMLLPAVRGRL